jgi:excisionase family DNA binding protein
MPTMKTNSFYSWLLRHLDALDFLRDYEPNEQIWEEAATIVRNAAQRAAKLGLTAIYERGRALPNPESTRAAAKYLSECVAALRQTDSLIPPDDTTMTVTEAADHLRVGRNKILGWIATGALQAANTATRKGGRPRYRIKKTDLDIFLDARTKVAKPNRTRRAMRRQVDKDVIEFFTPDGKPTNVQAAIRAARQIARG